MSSKTWSFAALAFGLVAVGAAPPPAQAGVSEEDLLGAGQRTDAVLTYGVDLRNQRFSPLDKITAANIAPRSPAARGLCTRKRLRPRFHRRPPACSSSTGHTRRGPGAVRRAFSRASVLPADLLGAAASDPGAPTPPQKLLANRGPSIHDGVSRSIRKGSTSGPEGRFPLALDHRLAVQPAHGIVQCRVLGREGALGIG